MVGMFTKDEEYYLVYCRKSPKSYRAKNYDCVGIEFKTFQAAQDYITKFKNCTDPIIQETCKKYCEFIIVKQENHPIITIKNE